MSTILAIAGPDTQEPGGVITANLLTPGQMRASEALPPGHEIVGVRGRTPIVRGPDGELRPHALKRPAGQGWRRRIAPVLPPRRRLTALPSQCAPERTPISISG